MSETGGGAKMPEPLSYEDAFAEMAAEGTEIAEFDATLADGLSDDDNTYEEDARRKHP
jgi:hypothetical protein